MDDALIEDTYQLIKKGLPVEGNFDDSPDISFDRLLAWLAKEIRRLLSEDLAGLLNALYRIDVDETRVKHILEISDPDRLELDLARLIIDRQLAKVETRRRYKGD